MATNYGTWKNQDLINEAKQRNLDLDFETVTRGMVMKALKNNDEDGSGVAAEKNEDGEEKQEDPMKGKCKIVLHAQEGEMGEVPQYVGFNGKDFYIPRDVECIVPKGVYEVLKNSREGLISTDRSGNVNQRNTQRFPFTVLEMGADA